METMAARLCCISRPVGEAPEIIQHGVNGFIVNSHRNIESYVRIAAKLLANQKLRNGIGKRARKITELQNGDCPLRIWKNIVRIVNPSK